MGARLRGRTATQRSKKGSGKFLERVLGRVLKRVLRRGPAVGFAVKKGSQKGFLEGGVSRRCLERPLEEYAPLGVRPSKRGRLQMHPNANKRAQTQTNADPKDPAVLKTPRDSELLRLCLTSGLSTGGFHN